MNTPPGALHDKNAPWNASDAPLCPNCDEELIAAVERKFEDKAEALLSDVDDVDEVTAINDRIDQEIKEWQRDNVRFCGDCQRE